MFGKFEKNTIYPVNSAIHLRTTSPEWQSYTTNRIDNRDFLLLIDVNEWTNKESFQ